jgi:exo-beta-1,3-glucanase (GH17 family)
MKSTPFAAAAIALLQLASAQPHREIVSALFSEISLTMDYTGRRHAHEHQHAKKDVIVTVIDTVYAEATAQPEVIVWVNQFGDPLSTMTEGLLEYPPSIWSTAAASTILPSTPEPAPAVSTSAAPVPVVAPVADVEVPAPAPASTTPVVVVAAPSPVATSVAAPVQTTAASSSSSGYGISYSPYNADTTCKSQTQVSLDFGAFAGGYSLVRLYGTDCNQVATALTAARAADPQYSLFVGIFDLSDVSGEVQIIIDAAAGNWANIEVVTIGNELVNDGTASPAAVLAAVASAKAQLEAAGYNGPVGTVDTLVATKANPQLCTGFAKCYVNCHPFFDGNTVAEDAGTFLQTSISQLQAVLADSSQEIVITETGWPWKGGNNGVAVPSVTNQNSAIAAITLAFESNRAGVIILSAFNDLWKAPGSLGVEQFWGLNQANSPSG